ncbi:MAG: bifunctional 4-hydroxy-2-oxoglutarate aldolase/2-dehydro-3-deoxy-phosphogluconate aldolase [Bacteroidota bacterium]
MPNISIEQTATEIYKSGIVPVFYHDDEITCQEVVSVCFRAGLRVFEFTSRGQRALANFKTIKSYIQKNCPGMLLGAGTIFNNRAALEFINEGADFVVSPAFIPSMVQVQSTYSTLWIPGCATISELAQARELEVAMMKVFPGDLLQPAFVAAALSVMPKLRLMPTGGVEPTKDSLTRWFKSGVAAVGIGSKLFSQELVEQKNWNDLEFRIEEVLKIVQQLRNPNE